MPENALNLCTPLIKVRLILGTGLSEEWTEQLKFEEAERIGG